MKHIAILAGTMQQYQEHKDIFLAPEGEKMYNITRPEHCVGCRFDEYRVVGTFWEDRKNAGDLLLEVQARTIKI